MNHIRYAKHGVTYEENKEYNIQIQTEAANFNGSQIHKVWISVNNIIVGVGYNYNAEVLNDVKVYCGNPWKDVFDTTIKDFDYGALSSSGLTQGNSL